MACRRGIAAMHHCLLVALLVAQLIALTAAAKSTKTKWLTLDGTAPRVVARGGFSGLLPDSSSYAYNVAMLASVPDLALWCDLQLTKDGAGICFPSLTLDNSSNIKDVYSKSKPSTYTVDGASTSGFFTIDYTLKQLKNVTLTQGIYSRSPIFDASMFPILTLQDMYEQTKTALYWLNVQHDAFFSQNKLSMQRFILGVLKSGLPIDYLSSPEVGFLRGIGPQLNVTTTLMVFRFLGQHDTEPTTNQTYGSLLKNLTFIKTFASGILVPKSYIWPFDSLYLLPHTTLVNDAHAAGLQVFASDFANDNVLSYNYSYDPVAEYLSFIDNRDFSVDGLLSDFPITPSEAIGCFAHLGKNTLQKQIPLVISHGGASGDYPSCTDLAYQKAIQDGADIIDCPVQMSKDGVPFCLSSVNLMDSTNIAQTGFLNLQESSSELHMKGIFSFKLAWKQIQGLTPEISNPYTSSLLQRNPKNKNAGKLISLADFLQIAKNSSMLSGVVIIIEHAAYLAQKQGISVTDAVLKTLDNAGYTNQTAKKVMIQSTNSSVLEAFKGRSYKLIYELDETIRDAQNSTIAEIKGFATAVVLQKDSIYPAAESFITRQTKVVDKLHSFNLSVYVGTFNNEFVSQDWDFFSDPIVELNSFVQGANIDGVITEFPKTAASYRRNRCLNTKNTPNYMLPVQPGSLLQLVSASAMPPAMAPAPILSDKDVTEPPIPAVVPVVAPSSSPTGPTAKANTTSDSHHLSAAVSSLAMVITAAALLC